MFFIFVIKIKSINVIYKRIKKIKIKVKIAIIKILQCGYKIKSYTFKIILCNYK